MQISILGCLAAKALSSGPFSLDIIVSLDRMIGDFEKFIRSKRNNFCLRTVDRLCKNYDIN